MTWEIGEVPKANRIQGKKKKKKKKLGCFSIETRKYGEVD